MTKRRTILLAIGAALALPATAFAKTWEKLGRRSVLLFGDRDIIVVTALKGQFTDIKLTVQDAGIFMESLVIVYSNGERDREPVRYLIPKGGETRSISLRGRDRFIRQVELEYRSVPGSKDRAEITLWGLKRN